MQGLERVPSHPSTIHPLHLSSHPSTIHPLHLSHPFPPHMHTLKKKKKAFHLSLVGNSGHLNWARLWQPQEQCYPFLTMHVVFSCIQTKVSLPMLGILNVHMDVIAHKGCRDTIGESALKVDSGRKTSCRTGELNLPQWCAVLLLYQLRYIPTSSSVQWSYRQAG